MNVSVVIPTYFRHEDLAELFDSLLAQTFKPFEVIVVDDTPTSAIENLCEKYRTKFMNKDVELIYLRNPRKRSAAVARNVGVEKARGDIILFLDSDVVLFPDFIEKIVEVFKENPSALGVQGYIVNMNVRHSKFNYLRDLFNKIFFAHYRRPINSCRLYEYPLFLTKIINCEWLNGGTSAFRCEVFDEFRFDENLAGYSFMEDVLFSHSIFKKYPKSLFMTPYAKCIHKFSPKKYVRNDVLEEHKRRCRKYVLKKLFGFRGTLLYYWQNIGLLILEVLRPLKRVGYYLKRKANL